MSHWEATGRSNDWFTPAYIFDALGCVFDLDVAHPAGISTHVPTKQFVSENSLRSEWHGFVWMNPPFGGRNGLVPWMDKFFAHSNGIALTPDRTSAPWWQNAARKADAIHFVDGKIRFLQPSGAEGKSPSTGTTLFAVGEKGVAALRRADAYGLGCTMARDA